MARKRGGLAGFWDRSKKYIKPIATFTAGMVNPALGAAVGAAMGGLDREGQSGIGFDLKKGAIGGIQGYGMGKLGAASKGKIAGLFSGSASNAVPQNVANAMSTVDRVTGNLAGMGSGNAVSSAVPELAGNPMVADVTSRVAGAAPDLVSRVNPAALFQPAAAPGRLAQLGNFVTKNQGLISGAGKAVAGVLGQQAENAQAADMLALQRERFALEKEQDRREQERRERVARLLMPLFDQQLADLNLRRG